MYFPKTMSVPKYLLTCIHCGRALTATKLRKGFCPGCYREIPMWVRMRCVQSTRKVEYAYI